MLTQSPSIPRQLFIETWNESCIQERDILATTATIQSTEIPGKPTTHSQWNLASGPSDFQWDHGKVPYETPFQFYRISLLPQQVLPAAFQEVNTMFNSPSPLEYMIASWALPWPIVQLRVSYRKSPWFSSSLSSPLSWSSLLREPKISVETAPPAKQKWCHEMPPLITWDCHSIGQISMAVSSRYKNAGHHSLSCTITSFRQVCRENSEGKVSGTSPSQLWGEIWYGMVIPIPGFKVPPTQWPFFPQYCQSMRPPWDGPTPLQAASLWLPTSRDIFLPRLSPCTQILMHH